MDDNTKAVIGAVLGGIGTLNVGHGYYFTGSDLQTLAGAVLAIGGILYAIYKRKAATAAPPAPPAA